MIYNETLKNHGGIITEKIAFHFSKCAGLACKKKTLACIEGCNEISLVSQCEKAICSQ